MMLDTLLNLTTGSTTLWFSMAALLLFLVAIAVGSVTVFRSELAEGDFRRKAALMPAYEDLQAAEAALGEKRRERDELLEQVSSLRREQAEAQRHELDAQHWQSLAEQAKRDYDNRQDLVDEVERLRTAYEDKAKDLATRNEELAELTRARSNLGAEIKAAEERLKVLEEQRQQAEDMTKQLEDLGHRRDVLLKELDDIKDQRDERLRAAFEVDQIARRRAELEQALEALPDKVKDLAARRDALQEELKDLRRDADSLRETRNEVDRLQERKVELSTAIESLEREKERLEDAVGGGRGAAAAGEVSEAELQERLEDLLQPPACLFDGNGRLLPTPLAETREEAMLDRVRSHLEALKLKFSDRNLKRFHTCLKTGRISPLTVLAGISGTGKSILPQRYAEAMGIHFLKIAVEPRWDSPQDVLGFYNYLEKRYKATELARALVHMDAYSQIIKAADRTDERVLLILLDEMNLARVEYYFSEFLSRLEGRPAPELESEDSRRPSLIGVDLPIKGSQSLTIYPGHNVLFAGTMNEDESTQALSDKVLDRANMIRFARPKQLERDTFEDDTFRANEFLPLKTWLSWHKTVGTLGQEKQLLISDIVGKLNDYLDLSGRPFGHRVNQAIFAYVANHPDTGTDEGCRYAIADMLAMRILPKLRGIELEGDARRGLESIRKLARDELGDEDLADSIQRALTGNDMFTWTGA